MRRTLRHTATLLALGGLAVATSLPAAAQSGRAETITQRQSILTELSPTGDAGTSRVFTQLAVTGDGPVTVTLPDQSTSGLRSLDGFGKPDVEGDQVVHQFDAGDEDGDRARTVADNTAELPVSASVVYRLDGEEIDPSDLAGENGRVEVEYTVRNLTAEPRDIVSFDAENNKSVETVDVAVPMVGSMSLTLPPSFVNIDAPGAVTAGDGRGSTVVNFSLLLFAPLGAEEQVVSWSADAVDTAIPTTSLQVLPVDDRSFGPLNATAEAYKGAAGSLGDLANGALIINSNLQLLGAGASELLAGLGQLADGANALNDGLANTAAPGARQLSDGLTAARAGGGALSTGLGELALGANRLSAGLGDAETGAQTLASGLQGRAAPGAVQIRDGLAKALAGIGGESDTPADRTLLSGLNGLVVGVGDLLTGLEPDADPTTSTLGDGTGALALLTAGLLQSFGPDEDGLDAGERAAAGAAALGSAQNLLNAIRTSGAAPGSFNYSAVAGDLVCLNADCTANATVEQILATGKPAVGIPPGGVTTAILGSVAAGLQGNADDLGTLPASCEAAIQQVLTTADPDGLAVIRAARCIAESVDDGLNDEVIAGIEGELLPGLHLVRGGASNPAALDPTDPGYNPTCQGAPADGFQPCGIKQALQLLSAGSSDLADGLGDAADGSGALVAGLRQLDDGAGQLAAGAGTASSGAGELASGLVQLDDGAERLAGGLGDAADGSGQIAEGLEAAADGGQRLADGTGALSEGFENQLIAGVSAGRQGASQDHEQVKAVIARGREGAAPYGIADGAEATTVFQFDVAGVGTEEGPSTPLLAGLAGLAGLALAGAGALGMGLKRKLA